MLPMMQERGEHIPPEDSLEVARKIKETYCYTCADIVKVVMICVLFANIFHPFNYKWVMGRFGLPFICSWSNGLGQRG